MESRAHPVAPLLDAGQVRIHTRASHLTEELSRDAAAVRLLPGVTSVGAPAYLNVAEQAGDHA